MLLQMDALVGPLGLRLSSLLRPARPGSQVLVWLSWLHRRLVLRRESRDVLRSRVGWATAEVRDAFSGRSLWPTTPDPWW